MRARAWVAIGVGSGLALAAGSGYGMFEWQGRPQLESVTPVSGTVLATSSPDVEIRVTNPSHLSSLVVRLDGRDVTQLVKREQSGFVVPVRDLPDGHHRLDFAAADSTVFGGELAHQWTFTSDTTGPKLKAAVPAAGAWTTSRTLTGMAEPNGGVTIGWKGHTLRLKADATGHWKATPKVPTGVTKLRVTAFDAAGNRTVAKPELRFDATKPVIKPGFGKWITKPGAVALTAKLVETSPVTVTATLDGKPVTATVKDGTVTLAPQVLLQGTYPLRIDAKDAAGNAASFTRVIGVDTTDDITKNTPMGLGARGKDVTDLARRLLFEGDFTPRRKGHLPVRYDQRLAAAVKAFQGAHGLAQTGIADAQLLDLTRGKLIATKSAFHVQVVLNGRVTATFPIAIGQPAFPTPTGDYQIIDMQRNPTWFPPDSPWAKGLEPIPPGGANPLGTRWIGTSAPAIGFHGTPEDWTVGTAASHGCMRMHIPDVEKMYDMVWMGMRVEIRS